MGRNSKFDNDEDVHCFRCSGRCFRGGECRDMTGECLALRTTTVHSASTTCTAVLLGVNVTASRCVQCMTEHDCQKGEFCVSAKGVVVDGDEVFIGQCAAKESPLGKRCTPGVTSA